MLKLNAVFGQSNLTIQLSKSIDENKVKILYTDGSQIKFLNPKFRDKVFLLKEGFSSKYFRLIVIYPDEKGNFTTAPFFVNERKAYIKFNEVDDSISNKLSSYESKNVISISKSKALRKLNLYSKIEQDNYNQLKYQYDTLKTENNLLLMNQADKKLALKHLQYIKLHGKNYFYFWTFTQSVAEVLKDEYLLELYETYGTSFPRRFKESFEGKTLKSFLEGNLLVKIGMQSPSFKTADYKGTEISSNKLKGKFYLLSFWATWCGPCVAEIPQLKRIRNLYTSDKLEMISVSHDADSVKFVNGIGKYKMDWIHIFNKPEIINLFGRKPIPSLYVIDGNGKMIFSSWEKSLDSLEVILSTKMGE